jgi:uncharacterized protein YdeI (BOF family)
LLPPNIRGAYDVKMSSKVQIDTTLNLQKEKKIYKKAYFERNGYCILEHDKGQFEGNYTFDDASNQLTVTFNNANNSILKAHVKRVENSENIIVSGKIDNALVELELLKVR